MPPVDLNVTQLSLVGSEDDLLKLCIRRAPSSSLFLFIQLPSFFSFSWFVGVSYGFSHVRRCNQCRCRREYPSLGFPLPPHNDEEGQGRKAEAEAEAGRRSR
jgi:hypothetical protein